VLLTLSLYKPRPEICILQVNYRMTGIICIDSGTHRSKILHAPCRSGHLTGVLMSIYMLQIMPNASRSR